MSVHRSISLQQISYTDKLPSWSWSYDRWIYNKLWNQCPSPLTLWVWIPPSRGVLDTTLCDKVCQRLAADGFLRVLRFPPPINWQPRYNWNSVESGARHHKSNLLGGCAFAASALVRSSQYVLSSPTESIRNRMTNVLFYSPNMRLSTHPCE